MTDKPKDKVLEDALHTVHDALLNKNDGNSHREDFYWWSAVLDTFGFCVDDDGNLFRIDDLIKGGKAVKFDDGNDLQRSPV